METNKLPKAFKNKWLKALRSGDYPKGVSHLKAKENGIYTYCCLGVVGELCGVKGLTKPEDCEMLDFTRNSNMRGKTKVPLILQGSSADGECIAVQLATLNDKSDTFEPVIKWIEKNL